MKQNQTIEQIDSLAASNQVTKRNQKGASLVEYALLVALIAVVCVVAVRTLGNKSSQNFSKIASALP